MIKMNEFKPSRRQYAIHPSTLTCKDVSFDHEGVNVAMWNVELRACWFRLKSGVISACLGYLWDIQQQKPESVETFLTNLTDGRFGGRCHSRWDGVNFWTIENKPEADEDFRALEDMLAKYGEIPEGWEGWYVFK